MPNVDHRGRRAQRLLQAGEPRFSPLRCGDPKDSRGYRGAPAGGRPAHLPGGHARPERPGVRSLPVPPTASAERSSPKWSPSSSRCLRDATLIRKRRYSGFFDTDLEARLRAAQPEQVTVVGVCTDICVLHTIADLAQPRLPGRRPRLGRRDLRRGRAIPATRCSAGRWLHLKGVLGAHLL